MALMDVSLDDKFTLGDGRIFVTGTQALTRILLEQRRRDAAAGLNTAGFVSGYRGSPLGGLDTALWRAQKYLKAEQIHFRPGVNEDLAATSIWGTQQTGLYKGARYDGVFGMWYGKGPGVDRSGDAAKHGNMAGTAEHGGVLFLMGDDHGAESSTVAHQSDQALMSWMMPVLNPANVQDYLDFGLYGYALSRFSGLWVGFKCVSKTVESSASCFIGWDRVQIIRPGDLDLPEEGLNIQRDFNPHRNEELVLRYRLPAAQAFIRANGLDRRMIEAPARKLGIVTTGKSYTDVREALHLLGLDGAAAAEAGISLYKVAMPWPLEPEGVLDFARGHDEILVVEEKRSLIEDQLATLMYRLPADQHRRLVGKADETGAPLLPAYGEHDTVMIAKVIADRLAGLGIDNGLADRAARLKELAEQARQTEGPGIARLPYFCSGCPHNTSTRIPEGSLAMSGIGCHTMAMWMPDRPTTPPTQMGGEGANWIGMAPFTDMPHVFQNLGDGTYFHSGITAIRAAIDAGVNITYKILFNDAVAMTGGQPVEGQLTVPAIARQVAAEGVETIYVVSDEPDKYPARTDFPKGVKIRHRDYLIEIEEELRETPGTTVIIYDQTCAAEKRRRRKRGKYPDPPKRVFINELVCEGCGDCSVKSNCVSVEPLETEFGRKRVINQSSCNKDYSCLNGFCPSFVTVHGGAPRGRAAADEGGDERFAGLPDPAVPEPGADPYTILVTGIGGTGVITIGALLGMAAHMEGKGISVLDFTGLAQKNGAVYSHLHIARAPEDIHAVETGTANADLLLGCDLIVSGGPKSVQTIAPEKTRAIVNSHVVPTAAFQQNPDMEFEGQAFRDLIRRRAGEDKTDFIDATTLAVNLMGDTIATNIFMVGYGWQKGAIPLSREAIFKAIELNGVAVEQNKRAFNWGRLAAHDRSAVEAVVADVLPEPVAPQKSRSLDDVIARRKDFLTGYQNEAWAERYAALVDRVRRAEAEKAKGKTGLAEAVAHSLFKLMAYKDEYEVARLFTDPAFRRSLEAQFEGDYSIKFHLAPPLLARKHPSTGEPMKITFGPWMMGVYRVLTKLKALRGTLFDPFGWTRERKMERRLIADYEDVLDTLCTGLSVETHALTCEIAALPRDMRGYGPIKEKNVEIAKAREAELLARFRDPSAPAAAAE